MRVRAETEHQLGICRSGGRNCLNRLAVAVDADDGLAGILRDARAGLEKIGLIDDADLHFAGEERRELEPVIRPPALGVELDDGNIAARQFLRYAQARWPAADDDDRSLVRCRIAFGCATERVRAPASATASATEILNARMLHRHRSQRVAFRRAGLQTERLARAGYAADLMPAVGRCETEGDQRAPAATHSSQMQQGACHAQMACVRV